MNFKTIKKAVFTYVAFYFRTKNTKVVKKAKYNLQQTYSRKLFIKQENRINLFRTLSLLGAEKTG